MGKGLVRTALIAAAAYATGGVGGLTAGQTAMAAASVDTYQQGQEARKEQEAYMQQAADQQKEAKSVEEAQKAQQASMERRQQIREERVRQARIMQSAANTGTLVSSGTAGGIGSLSTNLQSNLGFNMGTLERSKQISGFNQNAADLMLQGQYAGFEAQNQNSLFALSTSIFASSLAPKQKGVTVTTEPGK